MADNTRAPLTPTEVWQEWFNAASEAWSSAFENLSGDQMPSAARQFAKSYLSYTETFRQVAQEYFGAFQPATRPDIARIAELVDTLEDKVDHLDGAFGDVTAGHTSRTSGDALGKVERGLAQVQNSMSEQGPLVERRLDQVGQQLGQVEQKLGSVETAAGQLQKDLGDQASVVERRLHQVEQKLGRMETAVSHLESTLDRLITVLEQSGEAKKGKGKEPTAEEKAGTEHGAVGAQPADQV